MNLTRIARARKDVVCLMRQGVDNNGIDAMLTEYYLEVKPVMMKHLAAIRNLFNKGYYDD